MWTTRRYVPFVGFVAGTIGIKYLRRIRQTCRIAAKVFVNLHT